MADDEISIGDRVRVGEWPGLVQEVGDGLCHVAFDSDQMKTEWYRTADVVLLPREAKDPVDLVAAALTTAERNFSFAVGSGQVPPGQYLTERDKARDVLEALDAAGWEVRQKDL